MAGEAATETQEDDVTWISEEESQASGSPDGDDTDAEGKTADEKEEKEEAAAGKGDNDKPKPDDEKTETIDKTKYSELETRYKSAESHIADLNRGMHGLRQELKKLKSEKKEDGEVEFTDAQLLNVLKEHPGDEQMQMQVMKQLVKQQGKKTEQSAAEIAETKQKQAAQQSWMQNNIPPHLLAEDSPFRRDVESAKDFLGLGDSPYAEFLGSAVAITMNMPTIIKTEVEKASKGIVKEKVEEKRKESIAGNKTKTKAEESGTGKGGAEVKLTASQMQAAKNIFGPSPTKAQLKKYSSMLR
jgi:hypothetical protein